jgi:hypothetical protein
MDVFVAYQYPLGCEIGDLTITVGGDVAFGHCLNRISGTLNKRGPEMPGSSLAGLLQHWLHIQNRCLVDCLEIADVDTIAVDGQNRDAMEAYRIRAIR